VWALAQPRRAFAPPPAPSDAPVLSQGAPSGAPGAPWGRALGARLCHASVGPGTAKARLRVLGCACAIPGRTPEGQMCALGVRLCAHAGVSPDTANSQGAPSLPRVRLRYPRAHPAKLQVHLGGAPVPCRCGPWHSQGAPSLPRVRLRYPRVHPVELQAPSPRCAWWRPRYAQKIWSGPVLPPPKFPGLAMESCLVVGHRFRSKAHRLGFRTRWSSSFSAGHSVWISFLLVRCQVRLFRSVFCDLTVFFKPCVVSSCAVRLLPIVKDLTHFDSLVYQT
jgi:hypothetical protein